MPKPQAPLGSPDDTEAQFYEALQRGDIDKLMAAWSDDEEVLCVHPGGPRILGHAAIRAHFEAIFANGSINARPESVRRLHTHASAVHSVVEHVELMTKDGPRNAWVIATNVYLKTAQGWRLVCHHASPGTMRESHEAAPAPTMLH
jgi:ketosteroid isomerase-like protein